MAGRGGEGSESEGKGKDRSEGREIEKGKGGVMEIYREEKNREGEVEGKGGRRVS